MPDLFRGADADTPIRGEILGPSDLEAAAGRLARSHDLLPQRRSARPLLSRLEDNQRALRAARQSILAAVRRNETITPAAEWLADNFHIVEEQVRAVRDALPVGYYRKLPKLASGPFARLPRVFALAWHYVEHTDSRFDGDLLRRYVTAYEADAPLTLGELWAVAISLRLVLVENLRRLALGVAQRRAERARADALAEDLLASRDPQRALAAIADRLGSNSLTARLLQRLRQGDPRAEPAREALIGRLAARGLDDEAVMRAEHHRQAANQVTVANIITSMRHVSAFDWPPFVEAVSLVEAALREDPAGAHSEQDFPTRDAYRHAVEELARGTAAAELDVVRRALALAAAAGPAAREAHIGHWLVGNGRPQLEHQLSFRPTLRERVSRTARAGGLPLYLSAIAVLTALGEWPLLALLRGVPDSARWILIALAVVPLSSLAAAIVQRTLAALVPARRLPKLAFRAGVPEGWRTLIAVPTLFVDEDDIRRQVEQLEIHYLSNPDGDLFFALLCDLRDAPEESLPGDADLVAAARDAVRALNRSHGPGPDGGERFLLLHRRRLWNASEGCWMGWERKRGKLQELNALLRGAADTSFVGDDGRSPRVPRGVRFVITLDADTRLPRDEARRLAGALAHPLNRPRFDGTTGRVVDGYGILQPRIVPMLPEPGEGTWYQFLFAGPTGIDPYVGAVSDVYQDLFRQGSYTGKGIYDIDAFSAALEGRVPENTLLSHDLFEGSFARCGLAADLVLFEEFPGHAEVGAARHHRWARGDWQLLPWLGWSAPDESGGRRPSGLDALARWKMFDNLRRTLETPASWLLLTGGWLAGAPAVSWALSIAVMLALPALVPLIAHWPRRRGIAKRTLVSTVVRELAIATAQGVLALVFLPARAWSRADAALRAVVRMYVTRRGLLEWLPAAQARAIASLSSRDFYRRAAPSLVATIAMVGLLVWWKPGALPVLAPLALAWLAAPAVARALSLPRPDRSVEPLLPEDALYLRLIARQTFAYFEHFAGVEQGWLAADNFQEDPEPMIATRTSPTNLGLALLSTVAAHDFGWIGRRETIERIEAQLSAIERLERHRGHLLNWYDTRTLQPLPPRYVSTVDSGNLAGHLLVLATACDELASESDSLELARSGARDAVRLAQRALALLPGRPARNTRRALSDLDSALAAPALEADADRVLAELARHAATAAEAARSESGAAGTLASVEAWIQAVSRTLASHREDVAAIAPSRVPAAAAPVPGDAGAALAAAPAVTAVAEADDDPDASLARRAADLRGRAMALAQGTDFRFLFEPERRLFAIGYQLDEARRDPTHFDLLASEARLASFLAISREQAPVSHWFRLGRPVAPLGRGSALLSWSGSMFEYLMPSLVMAEPAGSLLATSGRLAVREQIRWGHRRGLPWGISESAYNARDLQLNYQYGPFGVPTLGLRHAPRDEVVVAPYASLLAAIYAPRSASDNLRRLEALGARGDYGFFEAVEFTPSRLPEGADHVVIRAHMAHHQGMSILAAAAALDGGRMRARFHAQPAVRATELLLQERTPRDVLVVRPLPGERTRARVSRVVAPSGVRLTSPHTAAPWAHLLSNGRYSVALTQAGGGWSLSGDVAVTRFRSDPTLDEWGSFLYLRDTRSGEVWSATYQPTRREPDSYEAAFSEAKVEIRRRDGAITSRLEVVVSPEDDAELRRLTLTNLGARPRVIEVTSYAEICLATPSADEAHPAFAKLFLETAFAPPAALLARRRRRDADETELWAAHVLATDSPAESGAQYETDRARFLGRGRTLAEPAALDGRPLSDSTGTMLDCCFSLRRSVVLPPRGSARLVFTTLAARSREDAERLAGKYSDASAFPRAAALAWTHAQVELRDLAIESDEAVLFQRMASRIAFATRAERSRAALGARNRLGQSALWALGISGDLPIVLLRIAHEEERAMARQLVRAHAYWRARNLAVDLVLLNEDPSVYLQSLQTLLEGIVRQAPRGARHGQRGGIHVLRRDLVSDRLSDLLRSTAALEVVASRGTLLDQIPLLAEAAPAPPARRPPPAAPPLPAGEALRFSNGLGGFADDGRQYVIRMSEGHSTPAPWINVIANPQFGFTISESGGGFIWAENSRENRLTPWSNDPVADRPGEVIYLRDEESGEVWTVTASPCRGAGTYVCRHGQGWTRFSRHAGGIAAELSLTAAADDPVKVTRLSLRNESGRPRRLSVTAYVEWVLGNSRSAAAPHVVTTRDPTTGALFAVNHWQEEFAGRVAFAWLEGSQSFTADRAEFLGRHGRYDLPAALAEPPERPLGGNSGAGLDPCAALRRQLTLAPGEAVECLFLVGQGRHHDEARQLIERNARLGFERLLAAVEDRWDDTLGALQISTPQPALDLLVNRWLLYQALGCRIWARSGFYQSSGAYGFRDQLQDVLALAAARPDVAREHLLRTAARQFVEGDVQHWWHPPSGRGVRTHCSDDLLWLPYAAAHLVEVTGDATLLDAEIPFLEQPPVPAGREDDYRQPERGAQSATLFEHCARAVDRATGALGAHGLPLMGSGDWNDGMNRVGVEGRGESVWLGWFLCTVLDRMAPLAEARGEEKRAAAWTAARESLRAALELEGWDGAWYRRAFWDDGTALGSAVDDECRIDSIAQSWAVISRAADPERARRAMAAVEEVLVQRGDGLVLLFAPPFAHTQRDPGYIKGYPPGVRENGGQYTHGAIWAAIAFAELGDGDRAGELLDLLNPVHHARTAAGVHRYRVEPYVAVADIYSQPPHTGRGGWTWYTGSASWMYRAVVEWLLGLRRRGDTLEIDPCVPRSWSGFEATLKAGAATYRIAVENPQQVSRGVSRIELDGRPVSAPIVLRDDGAEHLVRVLLGPAG